MLTPESIKAQVKYTKREEKLWVEKEIGQIEKHHIITDYFSIALKKMSDLTLKGYIVDADNMANTVLKDGMTRIFMWLPESELQPLREAATLIAKEKYQAYLEKLKAELIAEYVEQQEAIEEEKQREQLEKVKADRVAKLLKEF